MRANANAAPPFRTGILVVASNILMVPRKGLTHDPSLWKSVYRKDKIVEVAKHRTGRGFSHVAWLLGVPCGMFISTAPGS